MDNMTLSDILDELDTLLEYISTDELMMSVLFAIREIVNNPDEDSTQIIPALTLLQSKGLNIARESNSGKTSLPIVLLNAERYDLLVDCMCLFDLSPLITNPKSVSYKYLVNSFLHFDEPSSPLLDAILRVVGNDNKSPLTSQSYNTLLVVVTMAFVTAIRTTHDINDTYYDMKKLGYKVRMKQQRVNTIALYIAQHPTLIDCIFTFIHDMRHDFIAMTSITSSISAMLTVLQAHLPPDFIIKHTQNPDLAIGVIAYNDMNIVDAMHVAQPVVKEALLSSIDTPTF